MTVGTVGSVLGVDSVSHAGRVRSSSWFHVARNMAHGGCHKMRPERKQKCNEEEPQCPFLQVQISQCMQSGEAVKGEAGRDLMLCLRED